MGAVLDSMSGELAMLSLCACLCACSTGSPYKPPSENPKAGAPGSELNPRLVPITKELVTQQKTQRDQRKGQDIRNLVSVPPPYVIGPGDLLSIVVWGHPELATAVMTMPAPPLVGANQATAPLPPAGFAVDHDGLLQFPFVGTIKVAGLTPDQARDLVASRIATYINQPKVTLRVQAFRSQRIYVDGEVKAAGVQTINDVPMTLVEAINRAGGVTPEADQSRIFIIREGASYHIDMLQLVQLGVDPTSIMLKSGDLVRVVSRSESKVFVSGEVVAPRALLMHNGRITLNEAIGESGGISPMSGDARQVYVVRRGESEATVFHLDGHTPGALALAEGFELYPKDLVYVAATGLANWYRMITQLIPGSLPAVRQAAK